MALIPTGGSTDSRDIDLVVVTGAGASREFAVGHPGEKPMLPLMSDWSDAMVSKLASVPMGMELVGLERGLDGPTFEERLGRFLKLVEHFPSLERILDPSSRMSTPLGLGQLKQWHQQTQQHLHQCVRAIHES